MMTTVVPLFSVHFYNDDKLVRFHNELKPDQVFECIPMAEYSNSINRSDIINRMAFLFPGESFSCCWSSKNKYVLITRVGVPDYIQIPMIDDQSQLRIKLPPSPDSSDCSDSSKEREITCAIFCLRGTKRFLNWLNRQLPQL